MSDLERNKALHKDVLSEGSGADARERHVGLMLASARQRRRRGVAIKGFCGLALLVSAAALFLNQRNTTLPPESIAYKTPPREVSPLPHGVVKTGDLATIPVIATSPQTVTLLSTVRVTPGVQLVSDQELLGLLEGRRVAVVKGRNGMAEVMFFDEAGPSTQP